MQNMQNPRLSKVSNPIEMLVKPETLQPEALPSTTKTIFFVGYL